MPPRFVHALGVYFDRVAATYEKAIASATGEHRSAFREPYLRARTRSLAAYVALHAERTHLASYAKRVAAGSLATDEADAAARGVVESNLASLGRTARAGARDLAENARLALEALAMTNDACRVSGVDDSTSKNFCRRAESLRASAVDDALTAVLDALTEARVREADPPRLAGIFARVHGVWVWSGRDEAVERFAVDEVTDLAWVIYRKANWSDLAVLLSPCVELYESLAARLERDPKRHVAYSAKCAQVFVFRSDAVRDKNEEWALAERAIRLCPTHRNGRLSVAHLLCNRAIARLGSTWFPAIGDVDAARADIARAEELFPQSNRLGPAKQKLKEVTDRMGAK